MTVVVWKKSKSIPLYKGTSWRRRPLFCQVYQLLLRYVQPFPPNLATASLIASAFLNPFFPSKDLINPYSPCTPFLCPFLSFVARSLNNSTSLWCSLVVSCIVFSLFFFWLSWPFDWWFLSYHIFAPVVNSIFGRWNVPRLPPPRPVHSAPHGAIFFCRWLL